MHWYEQYSPGRLALAGFAVSLGLYLNEAWGPVVAFFVAVTVFWFAWVAVGPWVDEKLLFPHRGALLHLLREATALSEEVQRLVHKRGDRISAEGRQKLDQAVQELESAIEGRKEARLQAACEGGWGAAQVHLGLRRKGLLRDFFDSIGAALLIALLLRMFVIEAFKIPSGSMIPTLAIGDHIFVNKLSYGVSIPWFEGQLPVLSFGQPQPGEVVVFIAPEPAENAGEDFIKRVVASPGQTVRVEDGTVYVDGAPQERGQGQPFQYNDLIEQLGVLERSRATLYEEKTGGVAHAILLERLAHNSWPPAGLELPGLDCSETTCRVREGFVFCMGDNRDNSSDSRRWGAVPISNVKGKAMFVWLSFGGSTGEGGALGIRWGRIGTWID